MKGVFNHINNINFFIIYDKFFFALVICRQKIHNILIKCNVNENKHSIIKTKNIGKYMLYENNQK